MAAKDERKKEGKRGKFGLSACRHVVQVLVLLLFCVPVVATGWSLFGQNGVFSELSDDAVLAPSSLPFFGTLSSSSIGPVTLLDPFAVLQTIFAAKTISPDWIIGLLPVLIVYGLIRGRVFCGWVCPVNLVLEAVDWLRRRVRPGQKLAERVVPRHAKIYVAAAVLVLSALVSVPVFEVLSPVSFLNKGLVLGSTVGGVTLAAIVVADLFWGHRVWCRSLCPLGGFYQLLGKVGLVSVSAEPDTCIGCNKCKEACLCDPQILDAVVEGSASVVRAGDCMLCGKCVDVCPAKCLSVGVRFKDS